MRIGGSWPPSRGTSLSVVDGIKTGNVVALT